MTTEYRRAKVTPENLEEARRLGQLWESRSHPPQAEFGEAYDIGNQSAVSAFLRGKTPLSLKAARGFAAGLGCRIEDFSPRLAAEAAAISNMVTADALRPEVAEVALAIDALPPRHREWVLGIVRQTLEVAMLPPEPKQNGLGELPNSQIPATKHRKSA